MARVLMYKTQRCSFCARAAELLKRKGVTQIEEIFIDQDDAAREEMVQRTGCKTVPQIYIGDRHVGGFDDLSLLEQKGELSNLLNS